MNKIKLLDDSLINKISAGEVVERPASIVKELVENSIDAGAKNINIEIKNGGIGFIKIQDDGIGIPKDEIKTAFLRHATSKLDKIDDLENMLTLGFRGEALASICAISMLDMTTMTKDDALANRISIEGGKVVSEEEVAGLLGTTFVIKNIFFNTPARRKFLKKESVEAGYIFEIVTRLALAHPEISFRYSNNGSQILKTSGDGELKNAIFSVYGKEICKNLIEVEASELGYILKGYVALPKISRSNRSYGNFFINGRYIKSKLISDAIEDAYEGRLMVGKFPIFILNLEPPSATVDINVHPTKLEVRFSDEDFIYNFILRAVKNALDSEILIPSIEKKEKEEKVLSFYEVEKTKPFDIEKQAKLEEILIEEDDEEEDISFKAIEPLKKHIFLNEDEIAISDKKDIPIEYKKNIQKDIVEEPKNILKKEEKEDKKITYEKEKRFFYNYKIIGQVFSTYWIVEQENEMYLIDQHSAHERIIYERLLKSFREESVASQVLLKPIIIKTGAIEQIIIRENKELLSSFGFEIEEFGQDTYAIRQVPIIFKNPATHSVINEILDILADKNLDNLYDLKVEKIISMSCKKAVKGNDKLDEKEAKALIEDMLKLENPFSCPHGRPTIVKISKYEMEKMFNRT